MNPGLRQLEERIEQPKTEARAEHGDQNPKSGGGELRSEQGNSRRTNQRLTELGFPGS
jgi:hypothetical protein